MKRMNISIAIMSAVVLVGLVVATVFQDRLRAEEPRMGFQYAGTTNAPEIPGDLDWLNTSRSFDMDDFRGKIVMLDFWTYCCINCIHVIPDLKRLEAKYPNELVVIGVHSAKFSTEQETENIRQAIRRYELEHPVINDAGFRLWRQYGVRAWPTIALVDPNGKIVGVRSGEGVYDAFDSIIAEMVNYFGERGELDRTPLNLETELETAPSTLLRFPGKIVADEAGDRLYISDSNHNRIVVATLSDGRVLHTVGSGETGFDDGPAESATFDKPQGMALGDGVLYVADTENHAIRAVDLDSWTVTTLAGTGHQARSFNSPGTGRDVALNSPWDVLPVGEWLYIANAGSHQIWRLNLETLRAEPYAGSGRENRTDGPLGSAALAQPSGLATDGRHLYVADSEVSAIRKIDLPKGGGEQVRTLAGGELFEFGLEDATGRDARFQHPLGVAYHDGKVYVADTYNNAIRVVDAETGRVRTFLGDGEAGSRDGRRPRFDEPNDVTIAGDRLYIADTNNHRIRVASLDGRDTETFQFANPETLAPRMASAAPAPSRSVRLSEQTVAPGMKEFVLEIDFPDGFHLNEEAPSAYSVDNLNGGGVVMMTEGRLEHAPARIPVTLTEGMGSVAVDLTLYYCEEDARSLCYFDDVRLEVPLNVEAGGEDAVELRYAIPARM